MGGGRQGSPGGRPGVPQSNQPHAFMAAGFEALSRLFPGFVDDCVARGALHYDYYQSGELVQLPLRAISSLPVAR